MNRDIGFMQGRLSPIVDGQIQAFPWDNWQEEFRIAAGIGLFRMEWTLDQERLYSNPIMTAEGQQQIKELSVRYGVSIPSLTGDCFMQAPYWKESGEIRHELQRDFVQIVRACSVVGIRQIVVPLVDAGSLNTPEEETVLRKYLLGIQAELVKLGVRVIFESDFAPAELAKMIEKFPEDSFGINYDTGNSAALGFSAAEEFRCYSHRITNVHIKDRVFGGTTVPLGEGSADFVTIFEELNRAKYAGNLILQTARSKTDDHAEALCRYRDFVIALAEADGA